MSNDEIPETLLPILGVFFEEMWPVLESSMAVLTRYIESDLHESAGELPGKTFSATPGFVELQTGDGPLTHSFTIGDVTGRRMVIPYQIWMLQRIERVLAEITSSTPGREAITALVGRFTNGSALLELGHRLEGCRVRKEGALLYSEK